MLSDKYTSADMLKIKTGCRIFPDISDREFWEKAKENSLLFFEKAYKIFAQIPRGHLTASLYRQYKTTGVRINYENVYLQRRCELVIKVFFECFYNDGRFMEDILDLTWMILEETSWVLPAHEARVKEADTLPDFKRQSLDLFAAETACTMAFVYQTVGGKLDELSRVVTRRIKYRIEHNILDDYLERNDYGWMSFGGLKPNNWNVWINSNILASAMIICDDEERLRSIVHKVIRSIDRFLEIYPTDGACDEGPTYWTLSGLTMLEDLWLLNMVTDGQINLLHTEKVKNTLNYFMKVYTGNGQCVNFADSGAIVPCFFATIYKFAKLTDNKATENFAKQLYRDAPFMGLDALALRKASVFASRTLRMIDVATYMGEVQKDPDESVETDLEYYFESVEVMTARADANPMTGLFLAAKGGHNGESHNHNDVGQFIVYKNGTKFIVDSGNMVYSSIAGSSQRYELMTTRSGYHNVPLIDGFEQKDGREYASGNVSFSKKDEKVIFSLDIKDAYENRSDIIKWLRTIEYDKKKQIISITEDFEFLKEMEYQLNFLTPHKAELTDDGILFTSENGERLNMDFDVKRFEFFVETIENDDVFLKNDWGERLYRITLKSKGKIGIINYLIY